MMTTQGRAQRPFSNYMDRFRQNIIGQAWIENVDQKG